jgi:HK97 family phage major capsid protein
MSAVLDAARDKRAKTQAKLDELLRVPTEETRALSDEEASRFEELAEKVQKLDRQIVGLETEEARADKAADAAAELEANATKMAAGEGVIRHQPGTYRKDAYVRRGEASYLQDLVMTQVPQTRGTDLESLTGGPEAAIARLRQNWKEITRDAESGEHKHLARRIVDEVTRWGANPDAEQRVNPNTTAGTGGEFVPPLWLVSQYAPFVRPGRRFANRVTNQPLPPGIDVINLPKITVGSTTAIQTANAAAVASTDIATSTISANVNTIAGQEDISLQLLEQSPLAMDSVIFDDLSRDYDQRLDIQVVSGTGLNGQHKGVLSVTGATTNSDITKISLVNCSSTTFDGSASGGQLRSVVNCVNQIETLRIDSPTAIWVHPRRANSWAYAVDGQNRPLFIPAKYGAFNVLGLNEVAPMPEGVAGELYGLPVVKDANMVTTANGTGSPTSGSTQDVIVVLKEDDLLLWEGTMRLRALPEILSGTLQIRFQLYAYSAFMPNRFAASIAAAVGAGTAAPAF